MARLARTGNSSVAVTTLMLYPRRAEGGGETFPFAIVRKHWR